jgi:hypothetical protein
MKTILIICLLTYSTLVEICAQEKQLISIVFFKNPDNIADKIIQLKSELTKSKKNQLKYRFELLNFFTQEKYIVENLNSFESINKYYENREYLDLKNLNSKIESLLNDKVIIFNEEILTQITSKTNFQEVFELKKEIKKKKKGNITVYWFNGFVPYYKSKENVMNVYKELKETNELEKIIPRIVKPEVGEFLKPLSKNYEIEFEGVSIFDIYEIEIRKNNDNKLFINKTLKVIDLSEVNENDEFSLSINKFGKMILKFNKDYLGEECVKTFDNKEPLKKCDCNHKCLYDREFTIKIRGVVDNFSKSDLWSTRIGPFLFQCNNN